jgi:hypothetical protein
MRPMKSRQMKSSPIKSRRMKYRPMKSRPMKSKRMRSRRMKSRQMKSRQMKSKRMRSRRMKSRQFSGAKDILSCKVGYSTLAGRTEDNARCFKKCDNFITELKSKNDPRLKKTSGVQVAETDTLGKYRKCTYNPTKQDDYVIVNVIQDRTTGKDVTLQLPKQGDKKINMETANPM